MASYQPPIDRTAIFNSQSFSASNYTGESDPTKLDFPNAQGVPTMTAVNVSDGTNASLITPTGITTSGAQGASTIDIIQIPEKNTVNTFTQNQTLSGTANVIGGGTFGSAGVGNNFIGVNTVFNHNVNTTGVINLTSRNFLGLHSNVSASPFIGTASISGTTMTTSSGNPLIVVGTNILGTGVTAGTIVTAVASSTSFTISPSQTSTPQSYLLQGTGNTIQVVTINNGTAGVSGTTMTINPINVTLPIGTSVTGTGINAGTRITAITSPTVYTVGVASMINSTINATFVLAGSFNLAYSLSSIHSVTPSNLNPYTISLPVIQNSNVGAITTLRITNAGTTNVNVSCLNSIFLATNTNGVNTHTIYTGGVSTTFASGSYTASVTTTTLTTTNSPPLVVGTLITGGTVTANTYITAVLTANTFTINNSQIGTLTPTNYQLPTPLTSHTFMALPSPLGVGGFGWFQLGTV